MNKQKSDLMDLLTWATLSVENDCTRDVSELLDKAAYIYLTRWERVKLIFKILKYIL